MNVNPEDLAPEERDLHRALASAPPAALPIGFRDRVMRRVRAQRRVAGEWIVAALLALPSLAFLVRQALVHGSDFTRALSNVMSAAATETSDAFFFVDGLTVFALAFLGIASAFAAHALLASDARRAAAR